MLVTDFNVKNSRIGLVFSIIGIIAAILLFAAGPIAATHQAWAGDGGFGISTGGGFGGW